MSRELGLPKEWGAPILCDFGSTVPGDVEHLEDIQPNVYRAPEVIVEAPWTYSVDVWNVGCMVWDIFEGGHLLTGHDPELQTYRSRAHLAEMIALLGPPPLSLLSRENSCHRFFSDKGEERPSICGSSGIIAYYFLHPLGDFSAGIPLPKRISLEERETSLEGQDKWEPDRRSSTEELVKDEWLAEILWKKSE
ncbi:hypothetical protein VMCG_02009 [Cytospora schulzeri]|uniref:Protein kinase domain-containing protein n=1 Tax=Cytospora schulzeri TaxID=448051 RepID=A0A423X3M0_9PEZI|nr:hypothetical protein VMCG_02009 [Valsa malicola]